MGGTAHRGPILVVEDDLTIRTLVTEILTDEGYAVRSAPHGAVALQFVEQERPGLVLLDMRMPVLDGWGFARALADRQIALPIVVMTAERDAAAWATDIGAADHLAKPFQLLELLAVVARHYGTADAP